VLIKGRVRVSKEELEVLATSPGNAGSVVPLLLWQPIANASKQYAARVQSTA
jgi:hypothetical protein